MSHLYDVLLPLGAIAAAPGFLWRSLTHPEYRAHFSERLGRIPPELRERLDRLPRRPVWVQAVSVGEVALARTLVEALDAAAGRDRPTLPVVISSTTPAGREMAAATRAPGVQGVFHFPIDWKPWVARALDAVGPAAFVCVETEIWPGILSACARRGIPALIVNGRISARSFGRYRRLAGLLREPLRAIRMACMQTEEDAARARAIGIPEDRVAVTGNMKYDAAPPAGATADLRELYGLRQPDHTPVIVAGSTSPGEEEMLLDALDASGLTDAVLIVAPRHRERFEEVARLLARRAIPFVRRTEMPAAAARRVVLLDTLGELAAVYGLASVAFVGGSLVPRGGQNMIEPAARGVPVLFGPHTDNFRQIAGALLDAGAAFRVRNSGELAATLRLLVRDGEKRRRAGAAGRALVEAHRGATVRTVDRIIPYLG